jgi:NADH-quinone oxidoreductase subunit N
MELLNDINLYLPGVIIAVAGLVTMMLSAFNTPKQTIYWTSVFFVAAATALSFTDVFEAPQYLFSGMIQVGGFASAGILVVLLGTLFTLLLAHDHFDSVGEYHSELYPMILFASTGMIVLASAVDLVTVFIGLETMSVCLYVLAGMVKSSKRSIEAALKYFLLGAFSTGFLLYGIALLYGASGSTSLEAIAAVTDKGLIYWGGVSLLLVGYFFKVSIVPFHMWTPDVYTGAPTPVTGYMATAAKSATFVSFILVLSKAIPSSVVEWSEVLQVVAVLTMVFGNLIAMVQSNVKRMLAYSSIAHAGYALVGLSAGTSAGYEAVMFYLFAYTIMNIGAFGVVAYYERYKDMDLTLIDNYAGIGLTKPMMGVMLSVFLFSLVGIPPMVGFAGKYLVFAAAVDAGLVTLAVIGMLASAAGAYYYLRVMVYMYMKPSEQTYSLPTAGTVYVVTLLILAGLTLGLGLAPGSLSSLINAF